MSQDNDQLLMLVRTESDVEIGEAPHQEERGPDLSVPQRSPEVGADIPATFRQSKSRSHVRGYWRSKIRRHRQPHGRSMRDSVILIVCVRAQWPLADCKIDWAHKTPDAAHGCPTLLNGEETAIAAAHTSVVHGAPRVRIVGQGVGGRLRQASGTTTAIRHFHVMIIANSSKAAIPGCRSLR